MMRLNGTPPAGFRAANAGVQLVLQRSPVTAISQESYRSWTLTGLREDAFDRVLTSL